MVASPEIIKSVIDTFEQAAQLNRDCPLRQGNVVELSTESGDEVLITADLHGHRRNFSRILELADMDAHPRRHLVMQEVCHGGPMYPSGTGCMSHLMLEEVAALKVKYGDRFHFLQSNHELAELMDFPIMKAKRMLNLLFRCGLQEMYGDAADSVRDAAMDFIGTLPLAVRLPGGAFMCHSLPADIGAKGFDPKVFERPLEPGDLNADGAAFRLVWGRDYSQANAAAFAKLVDAHVMITGHEPCANGFDAPNDRQVILDCCSDNACCALLPISEQPISQEDVLARVRPLFNHRDSS